MELFLKLNFKLRSRIFHNIIFKLHLNILFGFAWTSLQIETTRKTWNTLVRTLFVADKADYGFVCFLLCRNWAAMLCSISFKTKQKNKFYIQDQLFLILNLIDQWTISLKHLCAHSFFCTSLYILSNMYGCDQTEDVSSVLYTEAILGAIWRLFNTHTKSCQ